MQRRFLLRTAGAAAALVAATPLLRAQGALAPFKFNLGWKVEASGAGFLLAQQRGYY
ncbi:MAG: ABC transporter permease, partial [Variovorax sp.]